MVSTTQYNSVQLNPVQHVVPTQPTYEKAAAAGRATIRAKALKRIVVVAAFVVAFIFVVVLVDSDFGLGPLFVFYDRRKKDQQSSFVVVFAYLLSSFVC